LAGFLGAGGSDVLALGAALFFGLAGAFAAEDPLALGLGAADFLALVFLAGLDAFVLVDPEVFAAFSAACVASNFGDGCGIASALLAVDEVLVSFLGDAGFSVWPLAGIVHLSFCLEFLIDLPMPNNFDSSMFEQLKICLL